MLAGRMGPLVSLLLTVMFPMLEVALSIAINVAILCNQDKA
jgi:hypothetical protein